MADLKQAPEPRVVDLSKMDIKDLKVLAYDLSTQMREAQSIITKVNTEIQRRNVQPAPIPEIKQEKPAGPKEVKDAKDTGKDSENNNSKS